MLCSAGRAAWTSCRGARPSVPSLLLPSRAAQQESGSKHGCAYATLRVRQRQTEGVCSYALLCNCECACLCECRVLTPPWAFRALLAFLLLISQRVSPQLLRSLLALPVLWMPENVRECVCVIDLHYMCTAANAHMHVPSAQLEGPS